MKPLPRAGVNVVRGLLRLWAVLTVLWLLLAGFLAYDHVFSATQGKYQFADELREGLKPDDIIEFKKPSEHKFPPSFSKLEYQYVKAFDASVEKGAMVLVDFPDGSQLYINAALDKSEHQENKRSEAYVHARRPLSSLGCLHHGDRTQWGETPDRCVGAPVYAAFKARHNLAGLVKRRFTSQRHPWTGPCVA